MCHGSARLPQHPVVRALLKLPGSFRRSFCFLEHGARLYAEGGRDIEQATERGIRPCLFYLVEVARRHISLIREVLLGQLRGLTPPANRRRHIPAVTLVPRLAHAAIVV